MAARFLSPTAINTYHRCPRKYYLKYIKRLKDKPNIHLYRGDAVHKALAKFTKLDRRNFPSLEDMQVYLVGLFDENWNCKKPQIDTLGLPPEAVNQFYLESQEMLRNWVVRHMKSPITGLDTPKTEVKLFSKTHGVMGIIDAVHDFDGKISLVDYKTSAKDDITPDIKVQLAVYALLYVENYLVLPDIVAIDFLKTGRERRFKVTDSLIDYAKELCFETHAMTSTDKEEDYPCTCGGWCGRDFIQQHG